MGRPPRPSHSDSWTPGGSMAPAARISLRLWEPRRRLPAMPRIRIVAPLGLLLDERELDRDRDLVRERLAAGGQRGVPVHVELGAVDLRLEVEVAARGAEGVRRGGDPGAGRGDRARDALDRELALDGDGAVLAEVDVARAERHLGVAGGVEELRAQDVGAELLRRADRDRLDLGGAVEAAVGQHRGDLVERALEEADALVADREAEAG